MTDEALAAMDQALHGRRIRPGNGRPPQVHEDQPAETWQPQDLASVLNGQLEPLKPTCLGRIDGLPLLYPGRLHDFHGEPETLKSWAAQIAVAEELKAGRSALYIDFEGEARDVVGHLVALGVAPERILEDLVYLRPEEPFGDAARASLLMLLATRRPAITVVDGVGAAMAGSGLSPDSNLDVPTWRNELARPLQRGTSGPTVLIDHVAKDRETRGRWAVGAGQKMAGIDGASFGFELLSAFGVGRTGMARLLLEKDRPGSLRPHMGSGREISRLRLVSDGQVVTYEFQLPPAAAENGQEGQGFRPTVLMERISKTLEQAPMPLSKNAIETGVKGKAAAIRTALEMLIGEGFVEAYVGERRAVLHRLVRPFREVPNSLRPDFVPTSSQDRGDEVGDDFVPRGVTPEGGTPGRTRSFPRPKTSSREGTSSRDEVSCPHEHWEDPDGTGRRCYDCGEVYTP